MSGKSTQRSSTSQNRGPVWYGPKEVSEQLLDRLQLGVPIPAGDIAAALGRRDKAHPRRPVARYLETAATFGLVQEGGNAVQLTYSGLCVKRGAGAAPALRWAFATFDLPHLVAGALLEATYIDEDRAKRRLAVFGQEACLGLWLEWLEMAALIEKRDGTWTTTEGGTCSAIDSLGPGENARCDDELYRRLVGAAALDSKSQNPVSKHILDDRYRAFVGAAGDAAERAMLLYLDGALSALGFVTQRTNGPRDRADTTERKRPHLEFGSEGDDLAAFLFRVPPWAAQDAMGWALAIEAKAGGAPKKAVTQALAFSGRVRSVYQGAVVSYPVVVSGRETYQERAAKAYARDNSIVHVPIAAVRSLVDLQMERLGKGMRLLAASAVISAIEHFRERVYTEPSAEELVSLVTKIADGQTATGIVDTSG